jgi:hypothetical protein
LAAGVNFCCETTDSLGVTIDEELIRDVFLRVNSSDLDQVLSAIEVYRVCVSTVHKLRRTRRWHDQVKQVMECARSCERALAEYANTGFWKDFQYPPAGRAKDFQKAHLVLILKG